MNKNFMNTTKRERFFFYNNLTCLVKALEGKCTTIDLRNDSSVTGKICSVDGYMNIIIDDAIFMDSSGNRYLFESIFVQARKIRYVHIPETMPIVDTIKKSFAPREIKTRGGKMKTFKIKKAMQRHLETVASLGQAQDDSGE